MDACGLGNHFKTYLFSHWDRSEYIMNRSDMLQVRCTVLLVINILYNNSAIAFQRFYGVRTNEYPKSSCQAIANIKSTGKCLGTCGFILDKSSWSAMMRLHTSVCVVKISPEATSSDQIGGHMSQVSKILVKDT